MKSIFFCKKWISSFFFFGSLMKNPSIIVILKRKWETLCQKFQKSSLQYVIDRISKVWNCIQLKPKYIAWILVVKKFIVGITHSTAMARLWLFWIFMTRLCFPYSFLLIVFINPNTGMLAFTRKGGGTYLRGRAKAPPPLC